MGIKNRTQLRNEVEKPLRLGLGHYGGVERLELAAEVVTHERRERWLQRDNQDETSASIKVRGTADVMMEGGRSPTGGIRSASAWP